jgi:hypothetical protein
VHALIVWSPPHDPGYAVDHWFCTARIGPAALAGLFVPGAPTDFNHLFSLELTARDRLNVLLWPASVRDLHRWPPGPSGDNTFYDDHYVPDYWHHFVAQTKGDLMEFSMDGEAFPPPSRPD